MNPLHLVFFNRAYAPEVSATAQLLTELAEGLVREQGCRVSVVAGLPLSASAAAGAGWRLVSREVVGSVTVWRARGTRWPKRWFVGRVVNYLSYCGSACLAALRVEPPDVVIALTDPPIIGLAGLLAARRGRARFVMAYKDLFPEVARLLDQPPPPLVEWGLHRVNRILLRRADRIVALGAAMRRRLVEEKGADPARVVIIPDWADTEAIVPGPKDTPFARAHGLADRFVVMHSGNLGASQQLEVLLEAAAQLRDLPDLTVLFVGDGIRKAPLQAQAAARGLRHVQFLPYQPKDRLSDSFAAADLFVVSLKPGLAGYIMPSKLYGILAAGRACVAAVDPDCDVARIVREQDCGVWTAPGDPQGLAAAIRALHADRQTVQRLGANARRAAARFDRRGAVRAYAALCRALVGPPVEAAA